MRTPEVDGALRHRNDSVTPWEDLRTLAAEVERLEKENFTLQWEPAKLKQRAEAAEARIAVLEDLLEASRTHGKMADERVRELEATKNALLEAFDGERRLYEGQIKGIVATKDDILAHAKELEAQNTRLREAYHTMRVKVVQIANGEPEEMRDALFLLTKETDSLADGKAALS